MRNHPYLTAALSFLGIFLFSLPAWTQPIRWSESPDKTFVFQLTNKEALKYVKGKLSAKQQAKVFNSPFTSFAGEKWEAQPLQGHFVYANIVKNQVQYTYHPTIPFQVFLFKEYGVLTLQVVDAEGEVRKDAKVRLGHKSVSFDADSQTYTYDDWSEQEDHILTVQLDKFRAIFDLKKKLAPVRYDWGNGNGGRDDDPSFFSYLITDKNKYKPGETVRFKSYALSPAKRPINDELTLFIQEAGGYRFKKLKSVTAYHPGGFADEFRLVDSLKLQLDRAYGIQLRDKRGRIVAETRIKYEDYILTGKKLDVKLDASVQYAPQMNKIEIVATDANGLMLQETEAEVTVRLANVLQSHIPLLSLPDTLMFKRVRLDAASPTVVEIPAGLFGASDVLYDVEVLVVSPDGERMSEKNAVTFYYSKYHLVSETRNDSIRFAFFDGGVERSAEALLTYNGSKEPKRIRLPYMEKFNQTILGYDMKTIEPEVSNYFPANVIPPALELTGGVEQDSLIVCLKNPLQLDVSWYMYEGNRLLQKGFGKEIDFHHGIVDPGTMYYAELFYSIGGKEQALKQTYRAKPDRLAISTDLPKRIYPGQQVNATLTVNNAEGRPVSGVDLTAWAVNSQLNYAIPDLPDYGNAPQGREQRSSYSMQKKGRFYTRPLDYLYWNRWANLEEMPYYQFTYPTPGTMFKHVVDTPDQSTQFAPFVMKDGQAVNIYVIELDDVPVYFSWTEQPKGYSFQVADSVMKHKVTLRLHDRAIVFEDFMFERGKKTLFSIQLERLPREARVLPLTNKDKYGNYTFLPREVARYGNYLCRLPVPANVDNAVLSAGRTIYPVYLSGNNKNINRSALVGPVPPAYMRYMNGVRYKHEGGFSYQFEDNVVYKYKDILHPEQLTFSSSTDFRRVNDIHLTKELFDSLVIDMRREKAWYPSHIYMALKDKRLHFRLPAEKDSTGVANLLLEDCATGRMLYPDSVSLNHRRYTSVPAGTYRTILLYNNGKYLKSDSIPVRLHAWLDVDMQKSVLHESDSLSMSWLRKEVSNKPVGGELPVRWLTQVKRSYGNKVSGYVYDRDGEPLVGCTALVKGTAEGTICNLDGYFELYPPYNGATLVFSYIGCVAKEMVVMYGMDVSVILEDDERLLEEVVVVGYGTARRSSLTGSVSGMSTSTSTAVPVAVPVEEEIEKEKAEAKEAERQLYTELLQLNGLRRNFSDVGFWKPALFTDKEGKATIDIAFPDNITKWEAVVYAMNRKLKTGTFRQSIQSYKPLMAELSTPQFLVVGDSSRFVGSIRNYTDDRVIHGKAIFTIGRDTLMNKLLTLEGGHNERLFVQPACTDSLTTGYLFTRDDGYRDGEERTIPVLPQGTEIEKGTLGILQVGKPVHIEAAADEVTYVDLTGQALDVYVDAAESLYRYRYLCNEQLASKLIGILASKQYAHFKGKTFDRDRRVNDIIRRLLNNRNDSRLWSWWGRSEDSSVWMSAHVLRALKAAQTAGYSVDLHPVKLKSDYVLMMPYRWESLQNVEMLHALSEWGVVQDYASGVKKLQKLVREKEAEEEVMARTRNALRSPADRNMYRPASFLKEKLLLWEILQKQNLAHVADSIRPYLKKDVLGGMYVDDDRREPYWNSGRLFNTLTAYRIIRNDSTLKDMKEAIQLYILRSKQSGWNTYHASLAVSTVLPDLLSKSNTEDRPATVQLTGKENRSQTAFPYHIALAPGEQLTVEKQDGVPVIYSAYTVKHVKEARSGDAFEVATAFDTEMLEAGTPATLTVTVNVKQEGAEYVMIEVPIPAGCEYASKPNVYWGTEVHREYFKEKTTIFCQKIPVGTHRFSIQLLPRYTGKYTVNPAKVELMYFPVVNANNDMRRIKISERGAK